MKKKKKISTVDISSSPEALGLPFSEEDWEATPIGVRHFIIEREKMLIEHEKTIAKLLERVKELERHVEKLTKRNSSNSDQPPSSDNPYHKPGASKEKKNPKRKKGHPGVRQKLLKPTREHHIYPERCECGCCEFKDIQHYYTHQHIELPKVQLEISHLHLYKGKCKSCGREQKGYVSSEYQTGYGPRLSAFIVELVGIAGNSRRMVQGFCHSVLGLSISLGAIQKVIERGSKAILPHYETIRDKARSSKVNHVDETAWYKSGELYWLWVMVNSVIAFFMVHRRRSREAFKELIGRWEGILVSDGYAVYKKWVNSRQTCLSHLIRRAKGLAESSNPELSRCGEWALKELRTLVHIAKAPPSKGEWRAFYARLCRLIGLYRDSKSEAGKFVRRIEGEMDSLFTFLTEDGVEPTNNLAERTIRFGVLWRKRSQGTQSDKGCRWVERILSLRQTCKLQCKSTFNVLVDAFSAYFKVQKPDLEWLTKPTAYSIL